MKRPNRTHEISSAHQPGSYAKVPRMRSDDARRVGQIEGDDTAPFATGKVADGGLESALGVDVGESGSKGEPQGEAASFAEGSTASR
jgi:hypothetical protein